MFCFKKFVWNFWDSLVNWIFFSLKNNLNKEKNRFRLNRLFWAGFYRLIGLRWVIHLGQIRSHLTIKLEYFQKFPNHLCMSSISGKSLTPPLNNFCSYPGENFVFFFYIESNMIPSRTAEAINLEHFQIDNQKSGGRGQKRSLTPCSESKVIKFYFESTNKS